VRQERRADSFGSGKKKRPIEKGTKTLRGKEEAKPGAVRKRAGKRGEKKQR